MNVLVRNKRINTVIGNENREYFLTLWNKIAKGEHEPATYRIFENNISTDTIYIDLGAHVGFTCLYAAQLAKKTFAFEPDPVAFNYLEKNLEANPSITNLVIFPYAVGIKSTEVDLMSRANGADSGSSLLMQHYKTSWKVKMIDFNKFLAEQVKGEKLFIKVDIEGYEYELIRGIKKYLKKYKPSVLLSLHPQIMANTVRGNSPVKKIIRRVVLLRSHILLFISLRNYQYIYRADGTKASLFSLLKKITLRGKLEQYEKDLFFTDKPPLTI